MERDIYSSGRRVPLRGVPVAQELQPSPPWQVGAAAWDFRRPLLLGVLNVTPDSFSDGGDYLGVEQAMAHAKSMVAEGADVIDLGGASSHPRAAAVAAQEELRRVLPVLERLTAECGVPISIDTQQPRVAAECLSRGAHLINAVGGLVTLDMAEVAAEHGAPLVVTYNNYTVPKEASGLSFLSDMLAFFDERLEDAAALGVERIILDPGYGFGKTLEENRLLLRSLPMLARFNRPVLVCTSRKGSLGRLSGEAVPRARLGASIASTLYAVSQGAQMVRVHDVKDFHQALLTWSAFVDPPGEGG